MSNNLQNMQNMKANMQENMHTICRQLEQADNVQNNMSNMQNMTTNMQKLHKTGQKIGKHWHMQNLQKKIV